jgi:hypothetical protein
MTKGHPEKMGCPLDQSKTNSVREPAKILGGEIRIFTVSPNGAENDLRRFMVQWCFAFFRFNQGVIPKARVFSTRRGISLISFHSADFFCGYLRFHGPACRHERQSIHAGQNGEGGDQADVVGHGPHRERER